MLVPLRDDSQGLVRDSKAHDGRVEGEGGGEGGRLTSRICSNHLFKRAASFGSFHTMKGPAKQNPPNIQREAQDRATAESSTMCQNVGAG